MTRHAPAPSATNAPRITPSPERVLRRKCDCGAAAKAGVKCAECEDKEKNKVLQRSAAGPEGSAAVPPIVHDVLRSSGTPLDASSRQFFEPRFGADFSGVRVHTDGQAAESARAVAAHAYTVGNDIVFGAGEFAPHTARGQALLAHELTHTLQQGGLQKSSAGLMPDRIAGNDAAEQEAARTAGAVLTGIPAVVKETSHPSSVHRVPWGGCPAGKSVPATAKEIYDKAEIEMVRLYREGRNQDLIVTNHTPLESNTSENPLIEVAKGFFYDPQRARLKRGAKDESALTFDPETDEGTLKAPPSSAEESELQRRYAAENSERVLKQPDLTDYGTLRVFDVTTTGEARGHGVTIRDTYVRLLNRITSEDYLTSLKYSRKFIKSIRAALHGGIFAPGGSRDFPQPSSVMFPVSKDPADQRIICFGDTDLDQEGVRGVLQYRVIMCATKKCAEAIKADAAGKEEGPREDYEIATAEKPLVFHILTASTPAADKESGKGKKEEAPWSRLNDDQNIELARSIKGLTFLRVQRLPGAYDKIDVAITTQSEKDPKGLRLKIDPQVNLVHLELNKKTRKLKETKSGKRVPFDFPGLSLGELTQISFSPEKGLAGQGVIRPSIPLLRGAVIQIAFSGEELRVTAPIPKDKLKSLPGFRVTEAGLNFELSPNFKPSGDIKFEIGPKGKPVGSGSVSVSADEQGLVAQGDIQARVPGFDEATVHVTYRPQSGWTGTAHLSTSKSYVRKAAVTVGLNDQGLDVAGQVIVGLPGDQTIELGITKKGSGFEFTGRGEFKVPGDKLDPVKLSFTWDGEHLTASGETGFSFKGFKGTIHVSYHDGKVSGVGTLDFEKGKAKGKLKIKMSPAQRFSGEGELTYQLTENLIATAGIAVDEQEKVTVKGALEFPKPLRLFEAFKGDREIFSLGISIPIPGASIGPVGLKARFEGSLSAGFAIGPGELRNVKLQTVLNPFEDKPNLDVQLAAQLYIGVNAHVSGSVSGAIMIDAAIASVSGGIKVTLTAILDGHLASNLGVHYLQGHFEVSGDLDLLLQLLFKLSLDAFVKAQAGIGPFTKEVSKEWNLAAFTFDPGLKVGVKTKKPIVYDSQKAFTPPSLDDIEIIKPNLNIQDMMQKIFAAGNKPEVTKE